MHDWPETDNDYQDPLEASVIAGAGHGGDGASEFAPEEVYTPGSRELRKHAASATLAAPLDSSIGLSLTTAGIRQLLGRKHGGRPKPLINITCMGCGRGSQEADEFVETDYTEWLGWAVVRIYFFLNALHPLNVGKII